jgi:antirestriction protein ArdC
MNAKSQFNVVSGAVFSGRNLESCLEAVKENGYKSNKWVTYFQASELGLTSEAGLRGKAVSLIRFKKEGKKSVPAWYNVFNLDLFDNVPAELSKKRTPSAKKAPKRAAKKANKQPKVAAEQSTTAASVKPAIPIAGEPGFFLIPDDNGVYHRTQVQ